MNALIPVTVSLVLVGALFVAAAILLGLRMRGHVPPELHRRWRLMVAFMLFFLAGYIALIVILASRLALPTEFVTGPVFLAGAVFVFNVISLTRETIGRIKFTEDQLRLLNESLERRVDERTGDLRRSHEFLRTVLDSLNDEVIIINVDDFTIVGANASFLARYGLPAHEVIGRTCHEVTHRRPEVCGPPDDICPLLETVKTGRFAAAEHIHYDRNGKELYVEVSSSPINDKDGKPLQIVHVSRDITERKTAEKAVRESEKQSHRLNERLSQSNRDLQEVNEELKSFAYIVSHDLRAPLVNIKGFSEELIHGIEEIGPLLKKRLDEFPQEEREKFGQVLNKDIPEALAFIGSSVNRMDNLINAILKLSRAGRRKLNPEPVSLQDLVQTIVNSLAHQIVARNVRVTVEGLPEVVADKTVLEQIFGNLLDNAVKYLEPGRDGEIGVSAERNGGETVFHVRDNGRGIAKEDIPKAFEIFRRVGKQDTPGEGMGLAYVKTLVRLLGGRIWCESEPGAGTTFSFTLPGC